MISSGKTDFERDVAALALTSSEQSRAYFERCYETAYRFVFNKFVTDGIEAALKLATEAAGARTSGSPAAPA